MHGAEAGRIIFTTTLGILTLLTTLSPVDASSGEAIVVRDEMAALGISGMKCKCTRTTGPGGDERSWLFQSEPVITGVRPDGPAHGKLRSGDVVVGIDGMLIMTRQAGVRFANVRQGEPVEITVRRGRRTITETIVPEEVPSKPLEIPGFDLSDREDLERLSRSIESLARLLSDSPEEGKLEGIPDPLELLEPLYLGEDGIPPAGWLGFGLSFSGSIVHSPSSGGPARWSFDSPPKVVSVEPDGPADRAGLKRGDVLTHVDGLQLEGSRGEKRFSSIEPGQTVTWTVRRLGVKRTIVMKAEERP